MPPNTGRHQTGDRLEDDQTVIATLGGYVLTQQDGAYSVHRSVAGPAEQRLFLYGGASSQVDALEQATEELRRAGGADDTYRIVARWSTDADTYAQLLSVDPDEHPDEVKARHRGWVHETFGTVPSYEAA